MWLMYFFWQLSSSLLMLVTPLSSETTMDLRAGYRKDELKWNISGGDFGPNVLSELKWKDIRMAQVSGEFTHTFIPGFFIDLEGDYAYAFHGKNEDSDFLGNDRTGEFLRSISKSNGSYAYDISAGLGYKLSFFSECFLCDSIVFSPKIGYAFQEQLLRMRKGSLELNLVSDETGSFGGLNSSYRARWFGPWIGFDASYAIGYDVKLFGSFQYHMARFQGRGHWNLRSDFADDFRHCGYAHGFLGRLGLEYKVCPCIYIGALGTVQSLQVRHGREKEFVAGSEDGESFSISSRLNEVKWRSYRVEAFLSVQF